MDELTRMRFEQLEDRLRASNVLLLSFMTAASITAPELIGDALNLAEKQADAGTRTGNSGSADALRDLIAELREVSPPG